MVGNTSQIAADCHNLLDIVNYCRTVGLNIEPYIFQEFADLIISRALQMGEIARSQNKE
jgi:hypothetical protein